MRYSTRSINPMFRRAGRAWPENDASSGPKGSIALGIFPPPFDVDRHEDRDRRPNHKDEEKEGVSDVAGSVRDESYDQRADERARLQVDPTYMSRRFPGLR